MSLWHEARGWPAARWAATRTPAGDYAIRVALFYGAISTSVGIYWTFMPVLLEERGLTPVMIGVMMAVPSFIRAVSMPANTVLFDRSSAPRLFVVVLSALMLAAFLWLEFAMSLPAILLGVLLYAMTGPALYPITDAVAMRGVERHAVAYGQMRLWGSVAFMIATFSGALVIGAYGARSVAWMLILTGVLCVAGGFLLPEARTTSGSSGGQVRFADVMALLRAPRFLLFLIIVAITQGSHGLLYSFGTLQWQARGIAPGHIGGLWAISVVTEIALLAFASGLLRLIGARGLILLSVVATVLRWIVMGFDPPLPLLYLLQAMHALTFGCGLVGAMYLIAQSVPRRLAAAAQGAYSGATAGLATGSAALVSGGLYAAFDVGAYWIMALVAASVVWPAWVLSQHQGYLYDEALR